MLEYARRLSLAPSAVGREDVEALRAAGFTDAAILHLAEIVAYYAFVNRIASGLGVALEEPGD